MHERARGHRTFRLEGKDDRFVLHAPSFFSLWSLRHGGDLADRLIPALRHMGLRIELAIGRRKPREILPRQPLWLRLGRLV